MSADERRFLRTWLTLSLVCLVVAAWRSAGYYHPDEQFQTLEFAAARLGITPPAALPWEFGQRMRSWLQPGLYVLVLRGLRRLTANPFAWATALRLLSGLYAWVALAGLALCCGRWLEDRASRRIAVRMVAAFCLLPFVLVRTSSESLAASSFCLGIALHQLARDGERPARGAAFAVGLLFGLAFEFRFAVGVMVAGWLAWAALVRRRSAGELATTASGIGAVLGAAALVDRWGYGAWCLPPWNYVVENLRAGQAAARFGSLPVWGYAALVLRPPFGPAALLAAAATAVTWLRHPRHVLTWSAVPMVAVHSLIAHKELRFLFPLLPIAGVCFGLAVAPGQDRLEPLARFWRGPSSRVVRRGVFAVNLVALALLCLLPVAPQAGLQRFVFERLPREPELLILGPETPYGPSGLVGRFYGPPGTALCVLTAAELQQALARGDRARNLVVPADVRPEMLAAAVRCRELYRSVPSWLDALPGIRALDRWLVLRCEPAAGPAADRNY
ncbi:MAG TPA: hypothetical protein VMX54_03700 [Vicinamibacteria bacterium]|nr:hypothetical protein [Vicinamibacteria bacterium]